MLPPIADEDCNPLDHNSPHKDPPAEFVEEAARAADPSDAMEEDDDDDDEECILGSTLHDLVGGKISGLGDLGYSSDDNDEDYDDGMKEDQYLNNVDDTLQYTVKRCEQGAFMFHHTTSLGSEAMNAANKEMCTKIAVCPITLVFFLQTWKAVTTRCRRRVHGRNQTISLHVGRRNTRKSLME